MCIGASTGASMSPLVRAAGRYERKFSRWMDAGCNCILSNSWDDAGAFRRGRFSVAQRCGAEWSDNTQGEHWLMPAKNMAARPRCSFLLKTLVRSEKAPVSEALTPYQHATGAAEVTGWLEVSDVEADMQVRALTWLENQPGARQLAHRLHSHASMRTPMCEWDKQIFPMNPMIVLFCD